MVQIFHIATVADWAAAQTSGGYTTSTIGRTLVEEGFIHASRADQWQGVRSRFYADVTEPLVLLVIDTERLSSPVVEEAADESGETFPHVYGPINPSAVVQTIPLDGRQAPTTDASFSQLFMGEVFHRVVLAIIAMITAVVGALVGAVVEPDLGPSVGLLIGLAVGVLFAIVVHRRRR
ncbi:hypothetical protein NSZ01_22500 [Nocardioides szechwanensis]|uniref:Uncharacterized conserved protein, DUF952 family n=1 Tax=Nocardioides szechwanensis TaxID=1005944 RepID=A0A1H0IED0_9ACTN|nr:DUF952 domain-containing protein [Nocardioides szechwanensis]GEP34482.1 hypothetical protein NSZ01_22500 [Nocardioides szechwanensis]SDO29752.1 Uncharacterized conserved protein, DUF952 family [Nocardioides szechwanensis]